MARCLRFPPPALANGGSNRGALIKLQKEKDETKTERKREELKKQSRKEYKEKEIKRLKFVVGGKVKKLSDEKPCYQQTKGKAELNAGHPPKNIDNESELLEKSDITEEYDQPSCSGSVCNLLDSVDSSNKRKRQDDPVNASESRRTILRIRLPLRKHREPNAPAIKQVKNCPAKGPETHAQERTKENVCHTKAEAKAVECEQVSLKPTPELLPLSALERTETKSTKLTNLYLNGVEHAALTYKTLIEDWVPDSPVLDRLGQNDSEEEDWLFGSNSRQQRQEPIRHKADNQVFCSRSSTLWPQATYLSEVDTFALPYTVPY